MFFKKIFAPQTNKLKEIDAVQTWVVSWVSRYGSYSGDTKKEFEVFTDEAVANEYAQSLRNAFALIRHTSQNYVEVNQFK